MVKYKHDSWNFINEKPIIKLGMLLLAMALLISNSSAANIVLSSETVFSGQTFDLNVSIDPLGKPIAGTQLDFSFNRSLLKINSVKEGNFFKQNGAVTFFNSGDINNAAGTVVNIFDAIIGKSNVSTPGTLIVINITAIGSSGVSEINLSNVKISDPEGRAVQVNIINGSGGSGSGQITVNPVSSNLIISNIAAATGKAYVRDTLAVGKLFYIDRTYKFTTVPGSYNGLNYIKTANNDRYDTRTNFLQFDVNKDVTIYVAYDDRITKKPLWLTSSFTDTGDNLVRDGTVSFSIYSRTYQAGHISLGGNSIPSGGAGGMYVVLVKPL